MFSFLFVLKIRTTTCLMNALVPPKRCRLVLAAFGGMPPSHANALSEYARMPARTTTQQACTDRPTGDILRLE